MESATALFFVLVFSDFCPIVHPILPIDKSVKSSIGKQYDCLKFRSLWREPRNRETGIDRLPAQEVIPILSEQDEHVFWRAGLLRDPACETQMRFMRQEATLRIIQVYLFWFRQVSTPSARCEPHVDTNYDTYIHLLLA
ncbi:hypothetical protein FN846DRAFT_376646 [Sphaerosporella brunnea]|uniref:Uncharacterized protein n=1 Tax=Sphaerosporella brunnea TaxID=1250544 RepID=A0A5J5F550_9PEZI|nr:hypothetical protein FN846DRAFT_376646 [Sphaerosporella brunnea]